MPNLNICAVTGCPRPHMNMASKSDRRNHARAYHTGTNTFICNGRSMTVQRNPETQLIPCPCGEVSHARYSYHNIYQICRMEKHPEPGAMVYLDVPFDAQQEGSLQNKKRKQKRQAPAKAIGDTTMGELEGAGPSSIQPPSADSLSSSPPDLSRHATLAPELPLIERDYLGLAERTYPPPFTAAPLHPDIEMRSAHTPPEHPQPDAAHSTLLDELDEDSAPQTPPQSDEEDLIEEQEPYNDDDSLQGPVPAVVSRARADEILKQLSVYELSVDPTYNRIICLFCESLVPFSRIYAHAMKHTRGNNRKFTEERRLPSKAILEELLCLLNAHRPVKLPTGPITPFEGLTPLEGIQCTVPTCESPHVIYSSKRIFNRHCQEEHPENPLHARPYRAVHCQALSKYRCERQYVEITYVPQTQVDALEEILAHSKAIGLGDLPDTYTPAINPHARNVIYSLTDWDLLIEGRNLSDLRLSVHPVNKETEVDLDRLIALTREYYQEVAGRLRDLDVLTRRLIRSAEPTLNTDARPFMKPQQTSTLDKYADYISQFELLQGSKSQDAVIVQELHRSIWSLLSQPSPQFLQCATHDPFTRFLLVDHLFDDNGALKPAVQFPHNIARAQWGFRATACWEVMRISKETGKTAQSCYEEYIKPWIHDGGQHMFNVMRQYMKLLTTVAKQQPGLARFNWDMQKTVLSIDGHAIELKVFYQTIHMTITRVEHLIDTLFRGCPYDDILSFIDFRIDPSAQRTQHWFRDQPLKRDIQFSIFAHEDNGWHKFEHRLLHHLSLDNKLFQTVNGVLKARSTGLWAWFGLLDEIVGLLFCLSSTTWGGGARGSECDHLKYANNADGGRNLFIFSNILTFAPAYNKNRDIHGTGPAARLAPYVHMNARDANNYLTYVFVQNGQVMNTDRFSAALASFTYDNFHKTMTMRDWRQVMCTIMVNIGHIDFGIPDEEDEDLKAIHDSFNHSRAQGEHSYAIQTSNALEHFSHTAIASDQRVCFRWHACIGQLHPSLASQFNNPDDEISREGMFVSLDRFREPILKALRHDLRDQLEEWGDKVLHRIDDWGQAFAPYLAQQVRDAAYPSSVATTTPKQRSVRVHPTLLPKLASLLPYGCELRWTCPEQAELVQMCLTDQHVLAVLPTGSGKTLSFFAAAKIHEKALFLVVLPLKALVDDMERRRAATGIDGGIYSHHNRKIDGATSRIVFVPSHLAAEDAFREWAQASLYRLKRIFMDEAHQIYTSGFRENFALLTNLTALRKPITFLSATIFPRSVDKLCEWMEIPRALLYEIRAPTGRKNIQYRVEHIEDKDELEDRIKALVDSIVLKDDERGLIYCKSVQKVNRLKAKLQFTDYVAKLHPDDQVNAQMKEERQEIWRRGKNPEDRWMIATMCFGQGIDFDKVRYVIHYDVRGVMDFVQEVGRAGRDGETAHSVLFWSKKPSVTEDIQPGDHTGLAEMGDFLTTTECRLLALHA
ncbi:hypothetical protein FPV67DRAFT_1683436 [Lyophyllum atratum]|nr:hypothetical protein FPV67DRAFT_1683436 [Lyophyllum atratum]